MKNISKLTYEEKQKLKQEIRAQLMDLNNMDLDNDDTYRKARELAKLEERL